MAKPTDLGEWATSPGQTLEPAAEQKTIGFNEGDRPPARWINWLWNTAYQWQKYLNLEGTDELMYDTPRTRTVILVPAIAGFSEEGPNPWIPANNPAGGMTRSATAGAEAFVVPLSLSDGCTLTLVRAGVVRSGGVNGMIMEVSRQEPNKTTPGAAVITTVVGTPDTAIDDAVNGDILTSGTISEVIDRTRKNYFVSFSQSSSKGTGDYDTVVWVEVTFTEVRATGHY